MTAIRMTASVPVLNLVFCRTDIEFADLWNRFALGPEDNGDDSPHIDIDVCNYEGGGKFAQNRETGAVGCGAEKNFSLFWHEDAAFWSSQGTGPSCGLTLSEAGGFLDGSFWCLDMADPDSAGSVDLRSGAFRCAPN